MDTNLLLEEILRLANNCVREVNDEDSCEHIEDEWFSLAQGIVALDEWIRSGKPLPERWTQSVTGRDDE